LSTGILKSVIKSLIGSMILVSDSVSDSVCFSTALRTISFKVSRASSLEENKLDLLSNPSYEMYD